MDIRDLNAFPRFALTAHQVRYAGFVGVHRNVSALFNDRKQRWGKAAGDAWSNNIVGCIGEYAYCLYRDVPWDSAVDIKARFEIAK